MATLRARARRVFGALAAALLLAVGIGAAGPALALPSPPDNTVYGNNGTTLYTINTANGAATNVGTLAFSTAGIGRDPVTGRVYYAENALPGRVAYFDPTTATNTILPTALGFTTNRLSFRADGQMFSMNPGTNNIYVVDKTTGNPTIVATVQNVPLNGGGDMAFAPNGDLYIVTATQLFRLLQNPIAVPPPGAVPSIATTVVSTTPGNANSITGVLFISNTRLLGTPAATNAIVDINFTAGGNSNGLGTVVMSDLGGSTKFADLVITAAPSSASFPRTGSASYAVNVVNNGPQSASGAFTVSFTLPAGVTLVGGGPFGSGWGCAGSAPTVCTHNTASLVVGASLPTLSVPVTTAVAAGTNSVSTTFTAASTTFEADASNNVTTVTTSVGAATISKAFLTSPIAPGGVSTVVFTLNNPTAAGMTGVSFSDTLPTVPGAMVVATPPNAGTTNCGTPTFAPAAGAATLAFSAGSIAAGANCTVRVDVTAPVAGTFNNTASGVTTAQTGAGAGAVSNTAALLVMTPATIAKSFAPSPVIPDGPSTLSLTLKNPAANGTNAINGLTFTDTFPTTPGAMVLADTTVTNSCGGTLTDSGGAALAAGSTSIKLTGGTLAGSGATCVVTVRTKAPTAGTYNNTTTAVGSANAGTGAPSNTASLVVSSVVAPSISKDFSPMPIAVNATSTLTFTLTNPNPTTALTGVAFSDTFPTSPGAMTVAAVPAASTSGCGTPTFAPAAGAASVAFSAGTIAGGATCVVKVDVKVNAVGAYNNTSAAVTATGPSALTGNTANAVLSTLAPPVVGKWFSPNSIGAGAVSTVSIQISNPNGTQAISGVAFTDTLPTTPGAMKVAAAPAPTISGCGAPTFAPVANATSVAFSGGTIAGGGVCTVTFNVTAPTAGSYSNSSGTVTTTNGGSGTAVTGTLTVAATAPPSITKTFLTKPMAANVSATLQFVITNPNTATTLAGVAFSDTLPTAPGAMVVAPVPAPTTTSGCGTPTFAPAAGAASVAFSGGSIAANGTCTVTVQLVAPTAGTYANSTSTVTSTTPATSGAAALDNVDVLAAPGLTKTFVTNPVAQNVPTTLRFALSNPNGSALTGLAFSDVFPASPGAMVVAPVPNAGASAGCTSPSFAPTAGAASVAFSTASVAAGATCTVSVDVVVPAAGTYNNTSTAPTSANGGTGTAASASLTAIVLVAPTVSKAFASAGPVAPNTPNQATITLGNSNATAITLAGTFTDTLPANVTVASPANSSGTCVGVTATPGAGTVTLASGASIPSGGCTLVFNVVASSGGTYTNTVPAGGLATSAGANAAAASASFTVPFAPAAVKSFTPGTIAAGATSVLKITLTNPNTGMAVSGAAFTDSYPAGLVNTASPASAVSGTGCSGTVTAAAGGNSLALASGVIPAGSSCDITVNVTSATAASYLNSSGPVTTTNVGTGSASSATLTVAVGAPLTVVKSFTPAAVAPGAPAVLKIRLTNPNGAAVTGATFNDAYPAGLVNTASPAGVVSGAGCSGSVTAAVNGASLALAGGTVPANASCDVTVNVTSTTPGSYLNDSGPVSTGNNGVAAASSATLVVLSPPTVTKVFVPASVVVGSPAVLKITLANPNTGTAISGAAFNDAYPPGLVNTASPAGAIGGSAGCAGTVGAAANGTALTLTGGTLPAGGSCDITANVTSAAAGSYTNSSGAATTTNAGNGTASLATLTVFTPLPALAAVKSFAPASIGTNDTSVLTIRLTNPNASAVTGVALTDAYPGSLRNTGTPAAAISGAGCSGSITAAAGGASLALTGASVPANASCDITVNVTSATAASLVNSTGPVTAANATTTTATNGTLTVLDHLSVAKSFAPSSIAANAASVLKITLTNPNATAISGAAFTDTYPAGLVNTATPAGAISGAGCSGSVTAAAGGGSLALAAASVPANGSCDITVNVTSAAGGSYVNHSGAVATSNAGAGASSSATLTVTATVAPSIAKTFSPSSVNINFPTTLSITVTNPNASAIAAVAFNDPYPSGLVNTGTPTVTNTCGGSTTGGAAGGSSIGLTGGTLAANASCTVTVKVTAATVGSYVNTTTAVTTTNGGTTTTGAAATQTLTVTDPAPPFIAKAFTPAVVGVNQSSTLQITITNPNGATALSGLAFDDFYPSGLMNAMAPNVTNSCGGAVTGGAALGTSIGLAAGSLAAGASCTITVGVFSPTPGSYANTTGTVTSTTPAVGPGNTASSTLTVAPKPTVAKSFSSSAIATGGTTTLSLTVSNAGGSTALTNLALTDTFPANLVIASPNALANSCGGSVSAAPGSGTLSLSGGGVGSGSNCTVSVAVTSSVAGAYNNTSGGASSNESGSAGNASNTATLMVLLKPSIAKSFAPASITTAGSSTLTLVLTNPNPIALTGAAFTDTFPANLRVAAAPNAVNTCTGTFAPAAGDASVGLAGGVIPPSGSCSVKVDVASALGGAYDNTAGGVATNETGAAGAPSNTATLTVTASGVAVSGYVYSDANHNLQRDAGEAGTGLALHAKLVPAGTPSGPATQAVAVNAATGFYQLVNVSPGEYTVVIDDNATLADVTPASPPGWTGTEAPDRQRRNVVVAAVELPNLNVGLFNGNLATGRVFNDNGAGSAVANNGVQEAGEVGLGGVAVKLTDAAGNVVYGTAQTDGGGNYVLWVPAAANGAVLKVTETNPAGWRSTGAGTAAPYDRATDTFTFTYALGSDVVNLNFGDVPLNTLAGDGQQGASPGAVVFYAHTFKPGSAGSVSFIATSRAGWAQVLYRDSNCNGLLDTGEPVIAGAVTTAAGSPVCVILKVSVPSGAAFNAQDQATLQADFVYTNASPSLTASLTNTDATTVAAAGSGAMTLQKTQDNQTPSPGSTIGYTLSFSNTSSSPITSIRINDSTPAFTTFLSAGCVPPLPAGVTACAVNTKPAIGLTGAIEWTLTGGLLPGASGQVVFAVKVDL